MPKLPGLLWPISWPTVGGIAITEAAKITGITPAMFTRSGRYVWPPCVIRLPITRLAYWIGIRRWPSCTNTTAATTPTAMNGMITRNTWSGFVHHALIPLGIRETIDAKIISEMPFPIPRWVISSPIHISSTVPAVSEITIRNTFSSVKFVISGVPPACFSKLRNRNT